MRNSLMSRVCRSRPVNLRGERPCSGLKSEHSAIQFCS